MKKIMKKVGILFMVSVMTMSSQGVKAEEIDYDEAETEITRYVNTNYVDASLLISSGTATCKGSNRMITNHDSKITMTLQKSSDGSSYSKVTAWSQTYTGTGLKTLTKTKAVTAGYYYRARVVVRVYSGSDVIEKITKYSSVVHY